MNKRILAALVLSIATTGTAVAGAITETSFTSAQTVVNMNNVSAPQSNFTYSGISFSNAPGDTSWRNLTQSGYGFTDDVGLSNITLDFAKAANKIGLDVYIGSATYAVSFFDTALQLLGTVNVSLANNASFAFAGWESAVGIAHVQILEVSGYNGLVGGFNDIRIENSANVPEPTSVALLGLGMAGLAASRRRRATKR